MQLVDDRLAYLLYLIVIMNLAQERGFITKGFEGEYNSFKKMGTVALFSHSARKRVGLISKKPQLDDLKKMLNELQIKKELEEKS